MKREELRIVKQFIELQRYSMGLGEIKESYENCDWETFIRLSMKNKCCILINNAVNKDKALFNIDNNMLDVWNKISQREFLRSFNMFNEFTRIVKAFEEHSVKAIVLKGYVLAALYGGPFNRYSSDLDIKIDKCEKDRVHDIFVKELGFECNEADSKDNVHLYYNNNLYVEVHFTLWEDYHGENIDILRSEELDKPETLIKMEVAKGVEVYTLGITEHLILQMFHIVKHYILEGIESRYFSDITLFINKYLEEIDFERFYRVFDKMNFSDFCIIYFSECIKNFGLNKAVLAGREMKLADNEEEFFKDIIFLGKEDLSDNASYSLLGILSPYVNGGKKAETNRGKRILDALFPSVQNIDDKYSYCKKVPALLPVAWVHRAIRTIYFKLTKGNSVYGVKDKIEKSEYRIRMMRNAGII